MRTGYTTLNHTHNAAAAGGRFPEFSGELSQPQILSEPCSVPSWSLGGITHTLSTYTDTMSCLDYMKQDSISEEVQSGSPPCCSSVRLHTGNSRGPTAAGDSDDNKLIVEALQPKLTDWWRGHESIHADRNLPPFLSCSHIEAQFVWADWKVVSC